MQKQVTLNRFASAELRSCGGPIPPDSALEGPLPIDEQSTPGLASAAVRPSLQDSRARDFALQLAGTLEDTKNLLDQAIEGIRRGDFKALNSFGTYLKELDGCLEVSTGDSPSQKAILGALFAQRKPQVQLGNAIPLLKTLQTRDFPKALKRTPNPRPARSNFARWFRLSQTHPGKRTSPRNSTPNARPVRTSFARWFHLSRTYPARRTSPRNSIHSLVEAARRLNQVLGNVARSLRHYAASDQFLYLDHAPDRLDLFAYFDGPVLAKRTEPEAAPVLAPDDESAAGFYGLETKKFLAIGAADAPNEPAEGTSISEAAETLKTILETGTLGPRGSNESSAPFMPYQRLVERMSKASSPFASTFLAYDPSTILTSITSVTKRVPASSCRWALTNLLRALAFHSEAPELAAEARSARNTLIYARAEQVLHDFRSMSGAVKHLLILQSKDAHEEAREWVESARTRVSRALENLAYLRMHRAENALEPLAPPGYSRLIEHLSHIEQELKENLTSLVSIGETRPAANWTFVGESESVEILVFVEKGAFDSLGIRQDNLVFVDQRQPTLLAAKVGIESVKTGRRVEPFQGERGFMLEAHDNAYRLVEVTGQASSLKIVKVLGKVYMPPRALSYESLTEPLRPGGAPVS